MLFKAGLERAFRKWKDRLQNHGFILSEGLPRLTNSRYVDDVMIFGKSENEICEMTEMLIEELAKVGLHLNGSKSKVITNDAPEYDWVDIAGELVDILKPTETHRYLGRHLPGELSNRAILEVNGRIKVA